MRSATAEVTNVFTLVVQHSVARGRLSTSRSPVHAVAARERT